MNSLPPNVLMKTNRQQKDNSAILKDLQQGLKKNEAEKVGAASVTKRMSSIKSASHEDKVIAAAVKV